MSLLYTVCFDLILGYNVTLPTTLASICTLRFMLPKRRPTSLLNMIPYPCHQTRQHYNNTNLHPFRNTRSTIPPVFIALALATAPEPIGVDSDPVIDDDVESFGGNINHTARSCGMAGWEIRRCS
ncbi:hypothetical protein SNOG_05393 [Parastagonospora nodorum SN15]|uniref:Uncharacterized protein n=1 Tax=Phaeosphaeria nodorum (strain SN15 / ATCC MYA-4574 / FGSC 10173) TaxID=321614 RepID=Q0US71_PHANO|nr:hypothetical protein SNOG_05393 [Parastagonospora nodorum SN15]EAT87784.1 hypothetical protein SNOG_05393 [Parastagonospora nodorum SN15]